MGSFSSQDHEGGEPCFQILPECMMLNWPTTGVARCPTPSCGDHANARGRILVRPGGIFQRSLGLDHSTVRSVAAWSSSRLTGTPHFPPRREYKCPNVLIEERSQSCSENDESSPKTSPPWIVLPQAVVSIKGAQKLKLVEAIRRVLPHMRT